MRKNNKSLLEIAIKIARKSIKGQYNFVALITDRKDKILSIGLNSYIKTHPLQAKYALRVGLQGKIYLHSEIDALIRARNIPNKMYVVRVNRKGEIRYAKPCPICLQAILCSEIKEVYYTINERETGYITFR